MKITYFPVFLFLLSGCASLKPKPIVDLKVSDSLPQEVRNKFEVSPDEPPSPPVEVPKVIESPKKSKPKTNKKESSIKKNTLAPELEASNVITYRKWNSNFIPGESFSYSVTYLGVHAGNLEVNVLPFKLLNKQKVYHFKANVFSAAFFSNVFKVNLLIESFVNKESFFSYRYQVSGEEGKLHKQNIELYDVDQLTVYETKKEIKDGKISESKNTYNVLELYSQDILSSFFYLRTLNFDEQKKQTISIISGDKIKKAEFTLSKEEDIIYDQKTIPCWVVDFQNDPNNSKYLQQIWIGKESRIIYKIKANIKWGSFGVNLNEPSQ